MMVMNTPSIGSSIYRVIFIRISETTRRSSFLILQPVIPKCTGEQPLTRKRDWNTADIHGYPTSSPCFSGIRCRPASTRRVHDQIAWLRCHQYAAFQNLLTSLDHVNLFIRKTSSTGICPDISQFGTRHIFQEHDRVQGVSSGIDAFLSHKGWQPFVWAY